MQSVVSCESINASANSNSGGVNGSSRVNITLDLVHIHITGVSCISRDAMVLLDDGVKHSCKVLQMKSICIYKFVWHMKIF